MSALMITTSSMSQPGTPPSRDLDDSRLRSPPPLLESKKRRRTTCQSDDGDESSEDDNTPCVPLFQFICSAMMTSPTGPSTQIRLDEAWRPSALHQQPSRSRRSFASMARSNSSTSFSSSLSSSPRSSPMTRSPVMSNVSTFARHDFFRAKSPRPEVDKAPVRPHIFIAQDHGLFFGNDDDFMTKFSDVEEDPSTWFGVPCDGKPIQPHFLAPGPGLPDLSPFSSYASSSDDETSSISSGDVPCSSSPRPSDSAFAIDQDMSACNLTDSSSSKPLSEPERRRKFWASLLSPTADHTRSFSTREKLDGLARQCAARPTVDRSPRLPRWMEEEGRPPIRSSGFVP
ncbi:BQ2448_5072 [Microbotryum intermedium]|uniref:BQ2448_5072 protein n=1 Tax=Microbotryum intermedium TaxID=269621 RepID=A0A238F611_9BASI|nr:BQ2448_5072 [Microbotryum intermedium]